MFILLSLLISSAHAMPQSHMTAVIQLNGVPPPSIHHTNYSAVNASLSDVGNVLNGGSSGYVTRAAEQRSDAIQAQINWANQTITQIAQSRPTVSTQYVAPPLANPTELLRSRPPALAAIDLQSIAAVPERALPYRFESPPSERHDEVVGLFSDLFKINPTGYKRKTAQTFGLSATKAADHSLALNNDSDYRFYIHLGEEFLDMAVGLDPVSGFGRGSFELLTGRNMVTGQNLTVNERGLAFLCVATLGVSHGPQVIATRMFYIFDGATRLVLERHALEAAMHEGKILFTRVEHLMSPSLQRFKIMAVRTAEDANRMFPSLWLPPFQAGSHIIEAVTIQPVTRFIRLHSNDRKVGNFMMKESSIKGLTAIEIRAKYAIPNTITHISNVHVPTDIIVIRGNIQNHGVGASGAIQYYLPQVQEAWFNHTRLFQ